MLTWPPAVRVFVHTPPTAQRANGRRDHGAARLRPGEFHRTPFTPYGVFVIANAPAEGKIVLNLFAGGISGSLQEFELGQQEYILKVRRAGRIYGKVVTDTTGEPVPEFLVKMTFSSAGGLGGSYSATWNREGYSFKSPEGLFDTGQESLPVGGNYKMTVFAQGFDPLTLDPVLVQPVAEDPNRTVFRLKPATVLAGVVVDGQGNPVKDAVVALFSKAERLDQQPAHKGAVPIELTTGQTRSIPLDDR